MNVEERLLKYVSFETTADEQSETIPSNPMELDLGNYLAEELRNIGLEDAYLDEFGYVYGHLPATPGCENETPIGFIAHMDTSPDASGANIKPRMFVYEGGDIELRPFVNITVDEYPFLEEYKGQTLIVTDGTTLLGADDKAGIAEIFTACEYLLAHPEVKHGRISVCITPDEEIGRGPMKFSLQKFNAKYGYTVDGSRLGEIEYENFNAASAKVSVYGFNIHPGSAKNKMVNSVLIASEFISMLPAAETPAHTEGYEGFYHVNSIEGDVNATSFSIIIRDHDRKSFEKRKQIVISLAEYMNQKYGAGTVIADVNDSYYNMKEKILPNMHVVERARAAMRKAGVTPTTAPIRGGTDGATISFMGMPCPNICTGAENFHGVKEFASVDSMRKIVEIIVNICEL